MSVLREVHMDTGKILTRSDSFSEIVMGNTALVRAMIEAGVKLVSAYPGSPTPEIADAVMAVRRQEDLFYFEYSVNEKVASEVAFGASISGNLSVVFFKSVGLNVAADSFVQFSLLDLKGGLVIVLGDDPGANSSQNEQDNRHYARMTNTPVLEPADPQQVYVMFLKAAELSAELQHPVILRMTTHVCHAKSRVRFGSRKKAERSKWSFSPEPGEYIPLTKSVAAMKKRSILKLEKFREWNEISDFNRLTDNGSNRGIITCGLPSLSLDDVLSEITNPPDLLVLGSPWPLPIALITDFCASHDEVLIVEELDPFIENEIKAAAYDAGLGCRIIGKTEPEDFIGELRPGAVRRFLLRKWPEIDPAPAADLPEIPVLPRPAQMCPGCGHRSAFHAISRALHPKDTTVADIGCHTLGYMEPYRMGQVLLSMGHSNGTGSGLSVFKPEGRVITFIGDSTFFHAGLPGIINAVYNKHKITLIVMENGTTAMTGHQDHAGTGGISVRQVLQALGIGFIEEVDTYKQKELTEAVKRAIAFDGFSVVIAKHPCMLKFTREQRRRGKEPSTQAQINQEVCRRIKTCISEFACPSFMIDSEDGSIGVNPELCIGDGSCVQTCSAAAVSIGRKQ